MLAQFTAFVSANATNALIIFLAYVAADDLLVFLADVKANGFQAVVHAPRALVTLVAEDISTKAVVAVAGAGVLTFLAGGANPAQAATDALVAGSVASTALVLNDIRVRILNLVSPNAPAPPKAA
ncbi:MAG: hypothetical protein ACHQC8_02565 [Solirubrobacterales bacterium]